MKYFQWIICFKLFYCWRSLVREVLILKKELRKLKVEQTRAIAEIVVQYPSNTTPELISPLLNKDIYDGPAGDILTRIIELRLRLRETVEKKAKMQKTLVFRIAWLQALSEKVKSLWGK